MLSSSYVLFEMCYISCLTMIFHIITFFLQKRSIADMSLTETPNEFPLNNSPGDGISAVKFGPNSSQFLLVSSWDCTVRLYDVTANNIRMKYSHSTAVLDCCFHVSWREPSLVFGIMISTNASTMNGNLTTSLTKFVCSSEFQDAVHAYSGGLDNTLKMYDFNTSSGMYELLM